MRHSLRFYEIQYLQRIVSHTEHSNQPTVVPSPLSVAMANTESTQQLKGSEQEHVLKRSRINIQLEHELIVDHATTDQLKKQDKKPSIYTGEN